MRSLARWEMARSRPGRLTSSADFDAVFRQGKSFADTHAVAVVVPRLQGPTRVGIVASKKTGKAHIRNRIRRRLREVWRGLETQIGTPADVVLIGRAVAAEGPFDELTASVRKVLSDAGLLKTS